MKIVITFQILLLKKFYSHFRNNHFSEPHKAKSSMLSFDLAVDHMLAHAGVPIIRQRYALQLVRVLDFPATNPLLKNTPNVVGLSLHIAPSLSLTVLAINRSHLCKRPKLNMPLYLINHVFSLENFRRRVMSDVFSTYYIIYTLPCCGTKSDIKVIETLY